MEGIKGLDARVLAVAGEIGPPLSYCSYRTLDEAYKDTAPWYLYGDILVLPINDTGGKREFVLRPSSRSPNVIFAILTCFGTCAHQVEKSGENEKQVRQQRQMLLYWQRLKIVRSAYLKEMNYDTAIWASAFTGRTSCRRSSL